MPRIDRHVLGVAWITIAAVAAGVGCSDSGGSIVDAAAVDGPAIDATSPTDAAAIDAAALDATDVDAAALDALTIDATVDIDAITVVPDATTVVPDATATTTQSTWTAASGQLPDQLCVPWELTDTSTPEQPILNAVPELILGNNVDSESMYYLHPAAALALPPVTIIETRMEFGSGSSQGPSRSGASISFADGPSDRKNALFIDEGVVFLLSAENTRGPSAAMPTSDTPHDYRIEITWATGAIAVFRDNAPLLTGATFVSPYDVPTAIYFGESSIVAHGTSIWESVSHNALAATACP